jgi:hypothetical protein
VAKEQPYIGHLTRLGVAAERGKGLEFLKEVSAVNFAIAAGGPKTLDPDALPFSGNFSARAVGIGAGHLRGTSGRLSGPWAQLAR